MKTIIPVKGLLALLLLWAGCCQAATFTCRQSTTWPPKDNVFTLNGVISVGDDIPVGTIVYRSRLWAYAMNLNCMTSDESGVGVTLNLPSRVEVISTPTSEVPGITVSPGAEKVYQTNVPGIGVAITAKGQMPYTWSDSTQTVKNLNSWSGSGSSTLGEMELKLVKTGPVSPGTVNAINFPQLQITFITPTTPAGHTFIGFPIPYSTLSYNGTIQIVKSTCRTEVVDKVVDLGSYEISDLKNSSAKETAWKDASLHLVGCQFSPGFYDKSNTSIYQYGSGDVGQGTPNANTVRLSLSASTAIQDAVNGMMALTPSSDSATGVGIQIGVKEGTEIKPYNFNNEVIFTPTSAEAQSLEIPIFARYYRNRDALTPGKANGAVVYTLNYY